jgi:hypothetical protein
MSRKNTSGADMGSRARVPKIKATQHLLFPPITYWSGNIDLPKSFLSRFHNWVEKNGERKPKLKMTTSWENPDREPHEVIWIAKVLQQISPIDTFVNSWGQLYEVGGFHSVHNHVSDENEISGCLYLTDGPGTLFQDPLMPSRHTCKEVRKGDFMIWNPYLYHSSPPHHSNRIILAFNLNKYDAHK